LISLVYSEDYKKHDDPHHPENKERLNVIMSALKNEGVLDEVDVISPELASREDILRVHPKAHVDYIESFSKKGGGYLDFDTYATPDTYQIARLSAGGAITASELVLNGYKSAYSLARPPGHHATSNRVMGFCIFNNMAIAIEYLKEVHKIKKFLIFDFDAHYGNGTADIFYQDHDVLYISIHQDPRTIFPGTGYIREIGSGSGEGYNLNIPMPPGSNTQDYVYILQKILPPVAQQFGADFYFVDVGFDGHMDDPLSSLSLKDDFFEWSATKMMEITESMVLILEGGYDLNALSRCNIRMIEALKDNKKGTDYYKNYYKNDLKVSDETKRRYKKIKDMFSPFFKL